MARRYKYAAGTILALSLAYLAFLILNGSGILQRWPAWALDMSNMKDSDDPGFQQAIQEMLADPNGPQVLERLYSTHTMSHPALLVDLCAPLARSPQRVDYLPFIRIMMHKSSWYPIAMLSMGYYGPQVAAVELESFITDDAANDQVRLAAIMALLAAIDPTSGNAENLAGGLGTVPEYLRRDMFVDDTDWVRLGMLCVYKQLGVYSPEEAQHIAEQLLIRYPDYQSNARQRRIADCCLQK